jgi:hypothetical protein
VCLAARRSPHSFSDVPRGADAPDSRHWRRGRHVIAGDSIMLENWPAPFGALLCEPIFAAGSRNAIGTAMGGRWRCSYYFQKFSGTCVIRNVPM